MSFEASVELDAHLLGPRRVEQLASDLDVRVRAMGEVERLNAPNFYPLAVVALRSEDSVLRCRSGIGSVVLLQDNTGGLLRRLELDVNVDASFIDGRQKETLGRGQVESLAVCVGVALRLAYLDRLDHVLAVIIHGHHLGEEVRRDFDGGLEDNIEATGGLQFA